ncbi:MAG: glycogen/starch synthase [Oscillospiraceae bacterium]|nr:glycogen/starch synthase [Oscillospiraceae bacterium]
MKILFVTSECAPFSKSGGLADVAFSLPPALKASGDEIAIMTPLYQCVRDKFGDQIELVKELTVRVGWREFYCGLNRMEYNGITVWFVDNQDFFMRPKLYGYDDDKLRFAFFSKAVVDLLFELDFVPEIIHCNDWETALAVIYLRDAQSSREELRGIRSVYTIHNIAYQGQFGARELYDTFGLPIGWYDGGLGYEFEGRHDINLMKGAMLMADAVSTVSPTYARELHSPAFGHGLQGVADIVEHKLRGILNGIDMNLYDPEKNTGIPCNFSVEDMQGKAVCKAAIQKRFGLTVEHGYPLLASVARLVEQKGIELVKLVLPGLMDLGVQLIVFGQGDPQYEEYFRWAQHNWPGQVGFSSDYNDEVANEVFAGADFYLMPSRFEPCGLSQMMAMRYGTVPIVHETGGLKDSVRPYSSFDGVGDGFSFQDYTAKALYLAVLEAVGVYFCDYEVFCKLRRRCMTKDFSWDKSAEQYNRMYGEIYEETVENRVSFEEAFEMLKDAYMKLDKANKKELKDQFSTDYHRVLQIYFNGRSEGVISVEFSNGEINIYPHTMPFADAFISASLDNLLAMAEGRASVDKLYLSGQVKITGNLAKGIQIRNLLAPASAKWLH